MYWIFLLLREREGGREMKRILIILLIITMTGFIFAADGDVTESNLNVYLTINPDAFGVIRLQDKPDSTGYTEYNSTNSIRLTLSSEVKGVAVAYLYYYAIGPAKISLTINSALKHVSVSETIDYSITLKTQDGWSGGAFTYGAIASNGTKTTSASTSTDKVRTKGICELSFSTLDALQNMTFGTYKSSITVTYTATT